MPPATTLWLSKSRKRPLILFPGLEMSGSASNLLLTVAESISTSSFSEVEALKPSPDRENFACVATDFYPRPYDHPLGHLLRPLQANLGY